MKKLRPAKVKFSSSTVQNFRLWAGNRNGMVAKMANWFT